jgi:hypothetical protein
VSDDFSLPDDDATARAKFRADCLISTDSYRVLAERHGMTRNAAIGLARRMGIAHLRPQAEVTAPPPKVKRIRIYDPGAALRRRLARAERMAAVGISQPRITFELEPVALPLLECKMIDLMDLTHDNCHWPIGDAVPYKFCGNPRAHWSQSYCNGHHKLGTRPLPLRREFRSTV